MMQGRVVPRFIVIASVAVLHACAPERANAPEGDADIAFGPLRAAGVLAVTAQDPSGQPLAGALVEVWYAGTIGLRPPATSGSPRPDAGPDSPTSGPARYTAVGAGSTDVAGHVEIRNLPEIEYDVRVLPPAGSPYRETIRRGVRVPVGTAARVVIAVERP